MTLPYPANSTPAKTTLVLGLLPESFLLLIAGLFLAVNFIALTILNSHHGHIYSTVFVAWLACAIGGQKILAHKLPQRNKVIFPLVIFLSGWGLVLISRLEPYFATRQALWLLISVSVMLVITNIPPIILWLRQYRYLLLIGGLALLISTIRLGSNPSGYSTAPELWLRFGGIYFQPSELLKIMLVAFLASYLAEQYPLLKLTELTSNSRLMSLSPRIIGPVLLMWGLTVVILVWQRDLGTAIIFFGIFLILLYVSSGYTFVLFGGAILLIVAGGIAYWQFAVVRLRIDIWLKPWPEADGRAYQIVQSLQAFASGGIFGQGVGQGSPTYIPVVHSDFVFAALAEEYGLLGVVVVLACITMIVVQGLRIAIRHQERSFQTLFAIGLSGLIAIQSILIMGGTIRMLPLTGVTLPFLSYGGSSLLTSFMIVGLLIRLSAEED